MTERAATETSRDVRKTRTPFRPGGLLMALLILIAVGSAIVWLGTSSVSESFRSAVFKQFDPQVQGTTDPASAPPAEDRSTTSPADGPGPEPTPDALFAPKQQPEAPDGQSLSDPSGGEDLMAPARPATDTTAEATQPPLSQDPSSATDDASKDAPDQMALDPEPARLTTEVGSSPPSVARTEIADTGDASAPEPLRSAAIADFERRIRTLPVEISAVGRDFIKVNLGESVQFPDGSTSLDARAREVLTAIAESLEEDETAMIKVIGHTDSSGTDAINQTLSAQRAATVSRFLVRRGIPAERVSSEGRGTSELKIDPEQERILGPQVNRRIEIEVRESEADIN